MIRIAQIVTAAAVLASMSAAARADTLDLRRGCYDDVSVVCERKASIDAAHSCAHAGMYACDKRFPEASNATPIPPGTFATLRARVLTQVTLSVGAPSWTRTASR